MNRKLLVSAAAVAASLTVLPQMAAAKPTISSQTAPGVNFSAYKTYSWIPVQVDPGSNPIMYQQIMYDMDSALAQKGYVKVDSNGQLSLLLTLGGKQKTEVNSWGWWGRQLSVYQYVVGQLSLDALDSKTQQPLWHGQASETVDPDKPNQAKINQAVQQLMVQFPATAATAVPAPAPAPTPQQP
jgi:hypothetical protein